MNSLLDRFEEIWVVDFEYQSTDGELPVIHCMVAREVHSLRLIRLFEDELSSLEKPPFEIGERSLVVGFYLPAEYGCFLQLGWNRPINSLDLYTEFRWLRNGIKDGKGRGLVDALSYFGLDDSIPDEKGEWRTLAIRGGPFSENERSGLLAYCQQDVDATVKLLAEMIFPHPVDPGKRERSLQHALLRGHYSWAVAAIERTGVLIDTETLGRLMQNWEILKLRMITRIDTEGVYVDGKFNTKRFETFLAKNKIPWPRLETGRLSLTDDTFREQARS
ncbi:MAG: DNA polymerase I, partial [Verrucomicrobia bacterium]|nr:DNA polymerase I [Verrucomicrobiota bacterium]